MQRGGDLRHHHLHAGNGGSGEQRQLLLLAAGDLLLGRAHAQRDRHHRGNTGEQYCDSQEQRPLHLGPDSVASGDSEAYYAAPSPRSKRWRARIQYVMQGDEFFRAAINR
ncbi:hypothetical protein D3C72_1829040 [compost metagenome]